MLNRQDKKETRMKFYKLMRFSSCTVLRLYTDIKQGLCNIVQTSKMNLLPHGKESKQENTVWSEVWNFFPQSQYRRRPE